MKHEFITKWQKQLPESQRSEFELDVYKYLTSEQPEAQPEPAKPFDRNRFEAMFRAVVETHEATIKALQQLDAYYASKENK